MTTFRINRSVIVTASRTGRLDLHGLSLDALPTELFDNPLLVENVTQLDLSSNRLTSLPPELVRMTKLKELLLDDNRFQSLPIELVDLPVLKAIAIEGNPLPAALLKLYERSRNVNTGSGRAKEVSSVLQWLMQHEEAQLQKESAKLSVELPTTPSVASPPVSQPASAPTSAATSPAGSRPSSADSDASRTKQAFLSSDLFSASSSSAATPTGSSSSKRLIGSARSNSSNVFACASETYAGHTGKRVHVSKEGNAASAPYGTDAQPVEPSKPRRMPREESEKENELSNTTKSAPYAYVDESPRTGKRVERNQQVAQSPFATLPNSATHFQSTSAYAQSHLSKPGTPTAAAGAAAVSRKVGDSEGMSAALSHLSLDAPAAGQRKGIRIVDKGTSDIFGVEPAKVSPRTEGKRHPSDVSAEKEAGHENGKYVQKGGRARVNHGQKDTALW